MWLFLCLFFVRLCSCVFAFVYLRVCVLAWLRFCGNNY